MLEENKKEKKKIPVLPILGILLLIGGIVSIFFFRGNKEERFKLSVEDSKLYPKFKEDIEEYTLYTNKNEIKIVCPEQVKASGCNKVIKLKKEETKYTIKSKDKEYIITIYKLEDSVSNIKISSVLGIPTEWVKSAELEVQIDNPTEIDELKYSFDGGVTWQKESKYKLKRNGTIIVVVKDYFGYLTEEKEVIIDKIDSINPKVKITKQEDNGKIVLTAEAEDSESGIKSYLWSNGSTEKTITVDKKEKYQVEVEDNAGNKVSETIDLMETVEDKTQKEDPGSIDKKQDGNNTNNNNENNNSTPNQQKPTNRIKAKFEGTGSTIREVECESYGNNCKVVAPQITRDGYEIIGWSKTKNSKTAEVQVGQEITVKNNDIYYTVTRKRLTVTLEIIDKSAASVQNNKFSCYVYNDVKNCKVTLSNISANTGYQAKGWSKERNKKEIDVTNGAEYNVSKNETLYSVTYNTTPITVTFNKNGASSISGTSKQCYKYNGETGCSIKSPTITPTAGFSVLGWNEVSTTNATWEQNTNKTVTANTTYYAITKSSSTYTATFERADVNASTLSKTSASCYRYNNESSCKIAMATATPNQGYKVVGWNENKNATSATIQNGQEINLTGNKTYYVVTKSENDIIATFTVQDTAAVATLPNSVTCTEGGTCEITIPTVTANSGYEVIGWSTAKKVTTPTNQSGDHINITNDTTYYLITRKSTPVTVTFEKNGASSVSSTTKKCYKYNGEKSCKITSSTITPKSGYEVLGWNAANTTSSTWNQNTEATFSVNATYYAITKKTEPYSATFKSNGSNTSEVTKKCYLYNDETKCTITTPTITPKSGYEVIGWSIDDEDHTYDFKENTQKELWGDIELYAITKKTTPYSVTFNSNGSNTPEETKKCYLYNTETICKVKAPTITPKSGFEAVGWDISATSTTSLVDENEYKELWLDMDLYAVTKSTTAYTATFTNQDTNAVTLSKSSASCYRYNGASSCKITAPTMTAKSGYTMIGFNTSSSATTSSLNSGASLTITSSPTYYTITKNSTPVTVTFDKNGASSIGATSKECYKYNGQESCKITSPTITAASGGTVIGWNTSSSSTTSAWSTNTEKSLSSSAKYYAVTEKVVTITFHKNDKASFIEDTNVSIRTAVKTATCKSYNNNGCTLKDSDIPLIIGEGREHWGFTKTKQTNYTNPENTSFNIYREKFKSNTDVYILTSGYDYPGGATMISEKLLGNVVIEYDSRINLTTKNAYVSYLNNLYTRWPEMFKEHGKLVLLEENRYGQVAPGSGGITYLGNTNSLIMLPVSKTNYYDYTAGSMVHELGHAFDNYYYQKLGVSISVDDLYNKYLGYTLRPMREYSFATQGEFTAEMFAFKYTRDYGINYNACTANEWVNGYQYTCSMNGYDDIEKRTNYYICVARNNYNEEASECKQYK